MTTHLTIKSHKTQLNGNLLTGDTYPIKQWIKTYLCGKWDADHKGWIVDLGQVKGWTGTCIKLTPAEQVTNSDSRKIGYNYITADGALAEDY